MISIPNTIKSSKNCFLMIKELYTKSECTQRYSNSFMITFICIFCNKDNSKNYNNENKIGISTTLYILNDSIIFIKYCELIYSSFENVYIEITLCFLFQNSILHS